MALQSELNGRMLEIIRELAGAAMITLPSSLADFENPETAGRYRALHALGLGTSRWPPLSESIRPGRLSGRVRSRAA